MDATRVFLHRRTAEVGYADLLQRWLDHDGMETQVNVRRDLGEPHPDKPTTRVADDGTEFFNFRFPKHADSEPVYRDFDLKFHLLDYAEAIGSTGWDGKARRSRWIGFDFDTITNHAEGVGVSEAELDRIRAAACAIPWVEVRKSTGGGGLHLYVVFDAEGVPTANHTEHAALARALLGAMSREAGFDFGGSVDCMGGVMWLWGRRANEDNGGLTLIRGCQRTLSLADLPPNWRDFVEVVQKKRTKVRVHGVAQRDEDKFEALASARAAVPLDASHNAVIDALAASGATTIWDADRHLLQSHTKALADVLGSERERLGLKGHFTTLSEGTDLGSPNCFAFPLSGGGWQVYRFGPGTKEDATWQKSDGGWTACRFNVEPTLAVAAKAFGGRERPGGKGYVFSTFANAAKAIAMLGEKVELDPTFHKRETTLKPNDDGRLVAEFRKEDNDELPDWVPDGKKWTRVFDVQTSPPETISDLSDFDHEIRALISPGGEDAGLYVRVRDEGKWVRHCTTNIKAVLASLGYGPAKTMKVMGLALRNAWMLTALPFQPEYLGGRRWNFGAAQFKVEPASPDDDRGHPYWSQMLAHVGQDLDAVLAKEEWAVKAGIHKGGDYLTAWLACLIRETFEPLPYLFMFGPQESGKSTFHEAIDECLIEGGIMSGDEALTNESSFNGELANAVLCVVEETDLSGKSLAANRVKDWVTARKLFIHPKGKQVYGTPNTTHWIQCSNDRNAAPIFKEDTRITAMRVPKPQQPIPKKMLLKYLKEEAPRFLRTLIEFKLPEPVNRMRLPVVETESKREAAEDNVNPVVEFYESQTFDAAGYHFPFGEFFDRFLESLSASERHKWTKQAVSRALPDGVVKGKMAKDGNVEIGNRSWALPTEVRPKLVRRGDRIVPDTVGTVLAA